MGNINHSSLLDQFLNLWKAQDLVSGWVIEAGGGRGQGNAWAVFVVGQYSAVLEVIGIAGLPFQHWGSEQGQADRWRNKLSLLLALCSAEGSLANGATQWAPMGWGRQPPILNPVVSAFLPDRRLGMERETVE